MEEIWGECIPRSAATTLQTYILQLRRRIAAATPSDGDSPKGILATSYGGYRLVHGPESSDHDEFQSCARRGGIALEHGDARAASSLFQRALALWRGPALADVPVGPVLQVEIIGMEEARMQIIEQRMDADLLLGRHSSLVAELRTLTARHPLNENLCSQFMTALYRCGSPWRALEAFGAIRAHLRADLGVEPTSRLQRMQQAVLSGDPALERPDGHRLPTG